MSDNKFDGESAQAAVTRIKNCPECHGAGEYVAVIHGPTGEHTAHRACAHDFRGVYRHLPAALDEIVRLRVENDGLKKGMVVLEEAVRIAALGLSSANGAVRQAATKIAAAEKEIGGK